MYEEQGTPVVQSYDRLTLQFRDITNIALDMCLQRILSDIRLVDSRGGRALTLELKSKYKLYTVDDIIRVFLENGYKIITTYRDDHKTIITIVWLNMLNVSSVQFKA
jgi:hypothetical protein